MRFLIRQSGWVVVLLAALALPARSLDGTVCDSEGIPVPGAVVYGLNERTSLEVVNNRVLLGEGIPKAISGRDGSFRIEARDGSVVRVFVRDMLDRSAIAPILDDNGHIRVVVQQSARLAGRLLNGTEPIANQELVIAPDPSLSGLRYVFKVTTDDAGSFVVPDIMPQQYRIALWESVPQVGCCFRKVMTKSAKVELTAGESRMIQIGGTTLPYVVGTVRDGEGNPLHGVWVRLVAQKKEGACEEPVVWSAVTDRDGNYAIHDVPGGDYNLVCFRRLLANDGSHTLRHSQPVVVEGKKHTTYLDSPIENRIAVSIDLTPFRPLEYGIVAPDFEAPLLDGTVTSLDQYEGRVVVLYFYASWCSACVSGIEKWDALAERYGDSVVILGVSLDESREDIEEFIRDKGIRFPTIYEGDWNASTLRQRYRVANIPTSFIIDSAGSLVQSDLFGGALEAFLDQLLGAEAEVGR